MHIITLVESDPKSFSTFESWIANQKFRISEDRKNKIRKSGETPPEFHRAYAREVKLYDITLPEENVEDLLKMLKNTESAGHIGLDKLEKLSRLIRMFTPIESVNKNVVKDGNKCPVDWIYTYVIGKIKDEKDKFGVERI